MFCPNCNTEYREGFTVCADCQVDLVEEIHADDSKPDDEDFEFVPLLATYNQGDISFIKSILSGEKINSYFKDEHFLSVRPAVQPTVLMVQADQVAQATEILSDVDLRYMLFAGEPEDE